MEEFYLRVKAPFAAFRSFQAGVYRTTSPTMPHSAALGLTLNLAGIEMRDSKSLDEETTQIREDLPCLRIAVGVTRPPQRSSLYQQLHTYPIGESESTKKLEPLAKGAKYWIVTARRELLVGLGCMLAVEAPEELGLFDLVRRGLRGDLPRSYGLPFAGDNNFLFDQIEAFAKAPTKSRWYTPIKPGESPRKGSCQLTIGINRTDNSKTTSELFAPSDETSETPPDEAWIWTPKEPVELR